MGTAGYPGNSGYLQTPTIWSRVLALDRDRPTTTRGWIMANVIYALVAILAGCYLLRWGFTYVIKRQRIDWTAEREHLHQDATRAGRFNKRLTRWYGKTNWWQK